MLGNSNSSVEQLRNATSKVEDILERASTPLKPYWPHIGRFLLVVTFLEDSLRIVTQWEEQLWYLMNHRGMPWGFAHLFLVANVIMMLIGSGMAVSRQHTAIAVGMLFFVIVSQAIGYGLMLDFAFFLRNLAVIGGLLMLLADAYYQQARAQTFFPGLPEISESNRTTYLQLAGRLLLVLLFSSFLFGGAESEDGFSWLRIAFAIVGAAACIMVAVGFQAKRSALVLVMTLSVFNVIINNWWSLHHSHPHRDFMKYDFFQTLSIMGGLILLSNLGPGEISLDGKKKAY